MKRILSIQVNRAYDFTYQSVTKLSTWFHHTRVYLIINQFCGPKKIHINQSLLKFVRLSSQFFSKNTQGISQLHLEISSKSASKIKKFKSKCTAMNKTAFIKRPLYTPFHPYSPKKLPDRCYRLTHSQLAFSSISLLLGIDLDVLYGFASQNLIRKPFLMVSFPSLRGGGVESSASVVLVDLVLC